MKDVLFDEIMEIHNNKRNFNRLETDFKAGRIIPFIGAGFSCPQFPSWEELIYENSKKYGIEDEINKVISLGNLEEAASLLERKMGRLEFKDYFLETFEKENIGAFTDNQLWLPKLFQSGIITTNYDHLLETLYKEQLKYEFELLLPRYKKDEAAIDRVIRQDKPYLIKLHGDVARYEHCIITEEQYREIYTGESAYEKMLGRIFENKIILFLGCSLISDRTLTLLNNLNNNRDIYHYAIVPLPKATRNLKEPNKPNLYFSEETLSYKEELLKRIQQLSSLGIRPIFYPYEEYHMISVLFEKLFQSGFDPYGKKAVPKKRILPDGLHVISAEDIHEKQSLAEDEMQYSESLYYRINSNWDCMYTIICNDKDIQDEALVGLATEIVDKGQSLIITGNGGQGKTSLMMRLAVDLALSTNAVSVIWISMDIISSEHIENFWSALETGKTYIICVDSPFYNVNMLKKLKSTFPMQQRRNVRFIFAERIQRIEELLEEEALFTGWIEPVSAICCMGNVKEKEVFKILESHNIMPYYYELKKDWKHSIIERTVAVNYGESMAAKSMDRIEKDLPESINSIAEQVYQIFFMMDKKYPNVSGINLDWKEWKEHLRKWFNNTSIDEYYYEPIAACSVFSLDLDLDTYAKMMHLPDEIWNKMNYMVGEHIEPVRYNRERNTIQPKHDVCADMFFNSHPKANLIRCLIQYLNVTKNTQEIFDNVLRKGKIYKKTILAWGKKLDYQPLIDHIKRIGYAPENKSRLILAGLWNCSSLEEQLCYIQKNLSDAIFEGLTDNESEKVFVEISIIYRKAKNYQLAEKVLCKSLEIDPGHLPSYNELGRLYVEQRKYEEAEDVFRKALEIDVGNLPIYNELGRLYVRQGKYEKAEDAFRKALEKGNLPSYNELGRLYVEQRKYEEAEDVFRKALEIDVGNLPIYNELGRLYVRQGKYEKAEDAFRKALEKGNLPSYNELGRLYVKQGKYEEAEDVFRKALEKSFGDNSYILTSLIKLYSKTNNYNKADDLIKKHTNKATAFYDSFCKNCYTYIKNEKGLREAIKYKKQVQRFNNKFEL